MPSPLRLASTSLLFAAAFGSTEALADDRPFGRGTTIPEFGFGIGWSEYHVAPRFTLGARHFVVNGFAVGGYIEDEFIVYNDFLRNDFKAAGERPVSNMFRIMPVIQYVFWRNRWFSPYVTAGIGPSILNRGHGVLGHWMAGPGFYIGTGSVVSIDLGVRFEGMFPGEQCRDAFTYGNTEIDLGYCQVQWGPRIGLVVAFGGRRREPSPPARQAPPPYAEPAPTESFSSPSGEPTQPLPAEPGPAEPAPQPMPTEPAPPTDAPPAEPIEPTGPPIDAPPPVGEPPVGDAPPPAPPSG